MPNTQVVEFSMFRIYEVLSMFLFLFGTPVMVSFELEAFIRALSNLDLRARLPVRGAANTDYSIFDEI